MQIKNPAVIPAAVMLILGLSACAGPNSPVAPSPSPRGSARVSPDPTASTTPAATVLGPAGVAGLNLGMTKPEATATGRATGIVGTVGTCGAGGDGRLLGATPADKSDLDGKLFFSASSGRLVMIGATAGLTTPQGIHLGSTYKAVKKAYPRWEGSEGKSGVGWVKVPGATGAVFRIYIDADQVMELTLQTADQDCAE